MVQTRTFRHSDGCQEVIRILTEKDLEDWTRDDPLAYEKSIVWLEDISRLSFVRVCEVRGTRSRRGRLRLSGDQRRVVGYAKLMADAPLDAKTKGYTRRLFYVKKADAREAGKYTPERAVDPRTVFPGVRGKPPSRQTKRQQA